MRVLDVVGRIVVGLLHRELKIEVERAICARHEKEPAGDILPHRVDDVLEQDVLSAPARHVHEDALVQELHILVEHNDPAPFEPEGLHRVRHAARMSVGVRAPDVDLHVEGALDERLAVIGEVDAEVGRHAGRADEHALDVLGLVVRAQPHRAVAVLDLTGGA